MPRFIKTAAVGEGREVQVGSRNRGTGKGAGSTRTKDAWKKKT